MQVQSSTDNHIGVGDPMIRRVEAGVNATLDEATDGAAEKLERLLDRTLGRLNDPRGRTSYGDDQAI
jgi:hypothetical protein